MSEKFSGRTINPKQTNEQTNFDLPPKTFGTMGKKGTSIYEGGNLLDY